MFILWSFTALCLFCFSNYSNISAGNFALSILVWRTERPVVLVVPTNCPNDCIAHSSSGKNSPQTPLLDEGYRVLDQFCLADVGVRFTIDLIGRKIKLTEKTVRSTMQIYTYKAIVYVSLGEVSTELFGFLEADTWFCTSRGSAEEKKKLKAEERAVWVVWRLLPILNLHVVQVLNKMPLPQGANKLKKIHMTKASKTPIGGLPCIVLSSKSTE